MKRIVAIVVFALILAASPAFAEDPLKIDVGGGVVLQDFESRSGGTGFDPRGYFGTLGWMLNNGVVFRLSTSKTSDEGFAIADFGFGAEAAQERTDLTRVEGSAGFMFNRRGLVHPMLHGGFARVMVKDKLTGFLSGLSGEVADDDDTLITLGAGVEVGQDHHILLLDIGIDSGLEVATTFGTTVKFDLSSLHVGYVYRF